MTTTTTAEKIAEQISDGLHWHDADGRPLDELAEAAGAVRRRIPASDGMAFVFDDGSSIVLMGGSWDIGLPSRRPDCTCWAGISSECECGAADDDEVSS